MTRDRGMFAIGAAGPIRAHHGSMSKEARREMEEDLKAGRLPALVGTSSLELGIDIGAVDLVVQLQSPKSVSQGLQRVGRSGHLVGQTSRGRIYATFREDLVEAAAVARGMLDGDVEPTHTPRNPLDVLAQQIVAMVAVETGTCPPSMTWCAGLPLSATSRAHAFDCGARHARRQVPRAGGPGHASLRARIAWDRVNDRLAALPGTRLLALGNAGTIPDTGAFDVYLADGKTKVGELDEEFIFETRPGDVFLLGSSTSGACSRSTTTGSSSARPRARCRGCRSGAATIRGGLTSWALRIGRLRREVAERLRRGDGDAGQHSPAWRAPAVGCAASTRSTSNSARNLVEHVEAGSWTWPAPSPRTRRSSSSLHRHGGRAAHGDPFAVRRPRQRRVGAGAEQRAARADRHRGGDRRSTTTASSCASPAPAEPPPVDIVARLTRPRRARASCTSCLTRRSSARTSA